AAAVPPPAPTLPSPASGGGLFGKRSTATPSPACGGGLGWGPAAVPSAIVPSTAPTGTLLPSAARISPITPAAGAGTSSVTLSVSSSTTGSSRATASPGCFSHRATVASAIDSPRVGTRISACIGSRRQRVADQPGLLALMPLEDAGRRRRRLGAAGKARPFG